ncbi:MAG: MGMT family protein [Spirochaetia bacterium]
MILIWLEEIDSRWFGAALHDGALVATAAAPARDVVRRAILDSLPHDAPRRIMEEPSEESTSTLRMLADLERGNEEQKRFELSSAYVLEPLRSVLRTAAAIPKGYVSTYGSIAAVAHTDAQTVGQIMATNPLYPVVPCHRVVGADLSLTGYRGSRKTPALLAKLERLRTERQGFVEESMIETAGPLKVVPVEWAIARAAKDGVTSDRQLDLW